MKDHLPYGEKYQQNDVKLALFWIIFKCKNDRVNKPSPAKNQFQTDDRYSTR